MRSAQYPGGSLVGEPCYAPSARPLLEGTIEDELLDGTLGGVSPVGPVLNEAKSPPSQSECGA